MRGCRARGGRPSVKWNPFVSVMPKSLSLTPLPESMLLRRTPLDFNLNPNLKNVQENFFPPKNSDWNTVFLIKVLQTQPMQENMSEKRDELLQAAALKMAPAAKQKNQYLLSGHRRKEGREIQLILHFAALWGFMIYRGYGVLLCVLDLNDKWLFIADKIQTFSSTIQKRLMRF